MDARLIVLSLFVKELGEDGEITSFDSRKRFQKTVYLGQLTGVDLGYRYGWYLKGPYSTNLTRDYYSLAESNEPNATLGHGLNPQVKKKLARLKPLLNVPENVDLDKSGWVELLASWHYLKKVSRKAHEEAVNVMRTQKPNLAPYIYSADQTLRNYGLLEQDATLPH
jgi:uncharacterized protein YwgA